MIVFAKEKCLVGEIGAVQGVGDVSPRGAVLEQGDPICTIHRTGETREGSVLNAKQSVSEIYEKVIVRRS
jgi:predicted ATP-grasp superfamily ATP-dependent carboligase